MAHKEILERLKQDIETLQEPSYGYIKAGLPRFPALFGRDSCIVSWQLIDYKPEIARNTIEILSKLQGNKIDPTSEEEPGKILHEWHPNPKEYKFVPWPLPYYGSVDSTPLFIYLCHLYYEKTTDTVWLESHWQYIERALKWCEKYGDFDGDFMLEYERKRSTGLTHQGWKDSLLDHLGIKSPVELVEVQGYYYAALMAGSDLALLLKNTSLSETLRARAIYLKNRFLDEFWLEDEKYFAFALEESIKPVPKITSNPGHLLFTGILDDAKDKIESVVKRLFQDDMWTPFGIRTHSAKDPAFNPMSYHLGSIWPHDNWIISQGLKRYGYKKEYFKIKQALIDAFENLGKIPELYTAYDGKIQEIPIACYPQAWASGALLNFLLEDE
ncbi:MAG: amylo-alpha-1,6-glucosidase, partial [Candidatus Paceibacteria bacterium]